MCSLNELEIDIRTATSSTNPSADQSTVDQQPTTVDWALGRLGDIELQIDTLRRQTAAGRRYVECSVDGAGSSTSSNDDTDSTVSSSRRRRRRILLRISNGVTTIIDVIEQALQQQRGSSPTHDDGGDTSDLEALHSKLKAIESAAEADALDDSSVAPLASSSAAPLQAVEPSPVARLLDDARNVQHALATASSEHDYDESLRVSAVSSINCSYSATRLTINSHLLDELRLFALIMSC